MTHAATAFLQVFLWEQFGTLSSKPTQFDVVEMIEVEVEVDGEIIVRADRPYRPRTLRWSGVKQDKNKKLNKATTLRRILISDLILTPSNIAEL